MADQNLKTLHPFLQENETTVSSGGTVKSFSSDLGSGPVLCVVHGWPQSSYMWRHVIGAWKNIVSLFVVELPGYGFSSLPPKHDKRTVGGLIVEALQSVFSNDHKIIWCGHDRGGRIGHRLTTDAHPAITSAIIMDIVPTTEQWRVFSSPAASMAYYHWPFLATPIAPLLIEGMGGGEFARINLERSKGSNADGAARFKQNDAMGHYAHQFSGAECIAGSCGDYAAGATEDVAEQEKDQKEGRKVSVPLLIVYSASNLGRMHDVPKTWRNWVQGDVRYEPIHDGYGHYLPEECPEVVASLVTDFVKEHAGK